MHEKITIVLYIFISLFLQSLSFVPFSISLLFSPQSLSLPPEHVNGAELGVERVEFSQSLELFFFFFI